MYIVDNAVIMAAGASSRFAPLSYEMPKALISVRGEVLIERQICQLRDAGIEDIYVVVGYKAEQFDYLKEKYHVHLVANDEYLFRNNHSSIYAVKDVLRNTYICSADNYFMVNPFEKEVKDCYYSALYAAGETKEWCLDVDETDTITGVTIGGHNQWYMLGHVFWNEEFSRKFIEILELIYDDPNTYDLLWESIYANHLSELKMKIRRYSDDVIFEFDTLDELREFDITYVENTQSGILKELAKRLNSSEKQITNVKSFKSATSEADGFTFECEGQTYRFSYHNKELRKYQ